MYKKGVHCHKSSQIRHIYTDWLRSFLYFNQNGQFNDNGHKMVHSLKSMKGNVSQGRVTKGCNKEQGYK